MNTRKDVDEAFQSDATPDRKWPRGVREITFDETSRLGVDNDGNLYWDGKLIEIRKVIDLNWWQNIIAAATASGVLLSGISALLRLAFERGWL